jgi:hypothetical protein
MLYSTNSNKRVTTIPYEREYKLGAKIGNTDIQTSSWMPGHDWSNTVFDPIYSKACNCDYDQAAQFFGLLVWEVFLNHPDCWAFGRYELDGIPIQGLTYFKVEDKACS